MCHAERDFHRFMKILGAVVCAAIFQIAGTTATAAERPNILLIVADDLGYEKLGCYGGLNTSMPNLDTMASRGTRFTRAYTSPVCTPSRMSLYTGMYTPRHKFVRVLPVHNGTKKAVDFDKRFVCYAQLLRDAGYQTSVTGKWQLAALEFHPEHCRSAGFDSWCVWQIWHDNQKTKRYWQPTLNRDGKILDGIQERFGPDVLTEYVIERMRAAKDSGKPFCIHHNMMLPHVPIVRTPDDVQKNRAADLDRMIGYLDAQVGKLLAALAELDLVDNTIVFFVGDNGTDVVSARRTTAGQVIGGKHYLNDGGAHVPLIAYSPSRIPAGKKVDALVDMADFFPTLCELAGVECPHDAAPDGVSFVGLLTGQGAGKRSWVTAGIGADFFVFDGHWRLHHKNGKLIDCRKLPKETEADMTTDEAKAAKARLLPALKDLRRL